MSYVPKIIVAIIIMIITLACVIPKKNTVLKTISDDDYIRHYKPFIVIVTKMYSNNMSEENLLNMAQCISKMDKKAVSSKKIEIYESILLVLNPIIQDCKKNEISKREAQIALDSLEFIMKNYKESIIIKEIYPKLKKALQSFA